MVDGEVYDQPWSTAECWVLEGDLIARGCMRVSKTWYPGLEF
jgi:phosphohistidine phosphatase